MNFDELYGNAKRLAHRAAKKINQTADMAALQVKLSAAEGKLEEAYTLLGRTSYLHFTGEEDLSKKVALAVENVDAAKQKVRDIKEQIKEAKARAEEARACRKDVGADADAADATAEEAPDGEGAEEVTDDE